MDAEFNAHSAGAAVDGVDAEDVDALAVTLSEQRERLKPTDPPVEADVFRYVHRTGKDAKVTAADYKLILEYKARRSTAAVLVLS
jgi:hypothetical protein